MHVPALIILLATALVAGCQSSKRDQNESEVSTSASLGDKQIVEAVDGHYRVTSHSFNELDDVDQKVKKVIDRVRSINIDGAMHGKKGSVDVTLIDYSNRPTKYKFHFGVSATQSGVEGTYTFNGDDGTLEFSGNSNVPTIAIDSPTKKLKVSFSVVKDKKLLTLGRQNTL